jgi:hypothetical protein
MILPQLQEALVLASDQMVARQRRRTQRFRLGLMTSAAVVTLGGGAVASQSLWAPLLGWEAGDRPSVSREAAPAAQGDRLDVLRRDQTAVDRGPAARGVLQAMSGRYAGVKVDAVRVVPDGRGAYSVLVPVSLVQRRASESDRDSRIAAVGDALCLQVVVGVETGGTRRCFTSADLAGGAALLLGADAARGVAVDGVTRVRFSGPDGSTHDAPVKDNVFVAPYAQVQTADRMSWLTADGRPVPFAGGATSRAVTIPVVAPPLPRTVHDCGRALGGVVPRTIPCGPRSKKYRPKLGTAFYMTRKP